MLDQIKKIKIIIFCKKEIDSSNKKLKLKNKLLIYPFKLLL